MLFNSLDFVLFFLVVLAVYWPLRRNVRLQNLFLLSASYFFYACWDYRFLSLIITSTVADFYLGKAIHEAPPERKTGLIRLSVIFNLTFLGFFKYFGFFVDSLVQLGHVAGLRLDPPLLHIVLPVGISFYTFQSLSYTIDIYRGKLKPTPQLLNFAVFVAYFPHLVAGPIVRARDLLPQVAAARHPRWQQMREGLWLCLWGLFKKVYVADNLAQIVNFIFSRPHQSNGLEALLGLYAFAFQIYGDFSGYTDIARGVSKLMGIELCLNFLFPYTVTNPSEFWKHWHISLSSWLREYLYISLGGNRGGLWLTCRNLFLTMLLGGLWHGAAWTFVWWGAYQGAILIVHRLWTRTERPPLPAHLHPLAVLWMFQVTCYGWLIFRARSVGQIVDYTLGLLSNYSWTPMATFQFWSLLLYVAPLLLLEYGQRRHNDLLFVLKLAPALRALVYVSVAWLTLTLGHFGGEQFIYFQF